MGNAARSPERVPAEQQELGESGEDQAFEVVKSKQEIRRDRRKAKKKEGHDWVLVASESEPSP